jgi:hypothetical protein
MTTLQFIAEWPGEKEAGISPGYEEVTIKFRYGQPFDQDVIEYWRSAVQDFYDGSTVTAGVI